MKTEADSRQCVEMDIDVSQLFHENTKIFPYQVGADPTELPPPLEPDEVVSRFRLPRIGTTNRSGLEAAIAQRLSRRDFDPNVPLSQPLLSLLLTFSCSYTQPFIGVPEVEYHRPAPSAGGRYPIEMYPIILRGADLPPGAYHYAITDHSLELIRPGRFHQPLIGWTLGQPYVADAGAVFVMAGVCDRFHPRYGERGYRYMLLEAGHIAQNLCLLGQSYGLSVFTIGGFVDTAINRLVGLDEVNSIALYLVVVGVQKGYVAG